ncbi:hypothetical protein B005_4796 [Nocardiopsis alba ATCC BAA-2165]|uniref:Uncharacterized protein n=1 Tax=Nocardiopsis alba (strain ATCC BAA-2165 / BE74) TaxID=1205910 RepID=J7LD71_NOCAA|nr:hypothetical protein B005_4796 [Nocardiopsis alba ATCC BAA-2165]
MRDEGIECVSCLLRVSVWWRRFDELCAVVGRALRSRSSSFGV